MEEDDEDYTPPKIMDDLEHFEQLKKDLAPASKHRFEINAVNNEPLKGNS